jgi:hypothetical protein
MMMVTRSYVMMILLLALGCVTRSPSTADTERQMRGIQITEFDHRSTLTVRALQHLDQVGREAQPPIILDYSPSARLLETSMITVARDRSKPFSLYDALSIVCQVSGLKWEIDEHVIRIRPDPAIWTGQH